MSEMHEMCVLMLFGDSAFITIDYVVVKTHTWSNIGTTIEAEKAA